MNYQKLRSRVLERDGYTCYFCGKYGNTIDHLLPRSKGGKNNYSNCVCACYQCNQLKRDMTLEEYYMRFKNKKRGKLFILKHPEQINLFCLN